MRPLGRREKVSQLLDVGDSHTGTITRISDKGVDVKVIVKGITNSVNLPTPHLTDDVSLAEIVKSGLNVGDTVSGLIWHKDVVTLMTMKPSIVNNWPDLPKALSDYEVGLVVPGVVQLVKQYGVMLRVPGLTGL